MADKIAVVLSKWQADDPSRRELEEAAEAELAARADVELTIVPELYDLAADGPAVRHLQSIHGDMIVLGWFYPRAAYWILSGNEIKGRPGPTATISAKEPDRSARGGTDVPDRTIWCLDLREYDGVKTVVEEVARIAAAVCMSSGGPAEPATVAVVNRIEETVEPRWYPVIDFDRCTNCLECLNFCLFGVFEADESDSIVIEQPDACRDGCPACSRICPAGAIMFPRHAVPAIGGDPQASLEGLKLDLSQIFGGLDPSTLAAGERDHALAEKQSNQTDLDKLIDDVDEMEL